ncbi:hypothetical protein HRbin17_00114 [bacterium HR17]|uniref:Helix-turn-helix domain-containing protein n=1 Tax=Candidatus Fervidibacter japonicus TaxID=2035412 RepID=A0A2H5X8W1_9BACT|nr:hypothetical protein HRbin17_00114 [bacterium HR17]
MAEFYNLTDIARMLGVSLPTVRRWVQEGKLKALHPQGTRLYRIPEAALREFLGEEWFNQLVEDRQLPKERGRQRRSRRS